MKSRAVVNFILSAALMFFLNATPLEAFDIKPDPTFSFNDANPDRGNDSLVGHFKAPVHERITGEAFCPGVHYQNPGNYNFPEGISRAAVYWGGRWNDDPPFQLKNTGNIVYRSNVMPQWVFIFNDAKKKASKGKVFGPDYALLYRTHFGDLQFLHSMASRDSEKPEETREHIMMWAEFAWKIATGSIDKDEVIRKTGVGGIAAYFPKYDHSATYLFTLGNPKLGKKVPEVALGSLLHLVQDSFSKSHVTRDQKRTGEECKGFKDAPGVIEQFHNYSNQNSQKHAREDSEDAFEESYNDKELAAGVVDVNRNIVQYWLRQPQADWPEVQNYLKCVFALSPTAAPAGPGEEFRRNN